MRRKQLDQFLSMFVLIAFCLVALAKVLFEYTALSQFTPDWFAETMKITFYVMAVLVVFVVFYNAWGFSRNAFYRILITLVAIVGVYIILLAYLPADLNLFNYMK